MSFEFDLVCFKIFCTSHVEGFFERDKILSENELDDCTEEISESDNDDDEEEDE